MAGRGRGRHRRRHRRWVPRSVLLLGVLVGCLAAGTSPVGESPAPGRASDRHTSSVHPLAVWWAGVLADLDAQRSRAFATATPQLLDGVYAPGSPAGALDRRRVRALAAAGLRTSGLTVHVRDARPVRTGPGQVSLRVVDTLAPYRLLDAGGRVVAARPGRGERTWTVTLHLLGGRWRIAEVAAG